MENARQRLIIVSNRPPISVVEEGGQLQTKRALGGLATALEHVWEEPQSLWVGWSGLGRSFSAAEYESLGLGHKLALINLESSLYQRYYNVFANSSIWPVMHGFKPKYLYSAEDLAAAKTVSERFASCVEHVAGSEDLIWVHDFHLMLLPDFLRQRGLRNKVGFFLHIPFPEPKQFKLLPDHRQIAQSLARCDLIGFQTTGDMERFKAYITEENIPTGKLRMGAYPIGVDYSAYASAPDQPGAQAYSRIIKEQYHHKLVLFSVSRLDYTKGILQQLAAVEALLAEGVPKTFVYKLVVAPSRGEISEYEEVRKQAADRVDAINRRYGSSDWQPVEYDYRSYSMDELAAWYHRADIMLVTPLIDGMNLIAKEYVAAHKGAGILVLSERAGAAEQMRDAILVNPADTANMVAGLRRALAMPQAEKARRMEGLRQGVRREDVGAWSDSFLKELQRR